MAASASDNKSVTNVQLEKWLNKNDVLDDFQQVEAAWTNSKHWTDYLCAEIDGVVVKHLAICKVCRTVLSVLEGTVQTLIRHKQSHGKSASLTGRRGQCSLASYLCRPSVPRGI